MLRTLFIWMILSVFLASCHKEADTAFDESPDDRINAVLLQYEKVLVEAADGWNATIVPANGATYHYHIRFNHTNRVFMRADFDTATAGVTGESSYRLKALQQPSLLFDTYSYLHLLSDPDGAVNGGVYGQGLVFDFEFSLDKVTPDSVAMTGRFHGSKLTLLRATKEDRASWDNRAWARSMSLLHAVYFETYFTRLGWGSKRYDIAIDQYNRLIAFYWQEAGSVRQSFVTRFQYTPAGIALDKPLQAGQEQVQAFTELRWDSITKRILLKVNGVAGVIAEATAPAVVDLDAPARWRQAALDSGSYWVSATGFTYSWHTDVFGVRSIPNYYYTLYYPRFGASSGIVYDLIGVTYMNTTGSVSVYGKGLYTPAYSSDGRMGFTVLGTYGTAPSSASVTVMNNVAAAISETAGYYLVQTGDAMYDMVSAKDAKTWIRWQLY